MTTEIGKYRKKPVLIEAMLWDGTREAAKTIIDWAAQKRREITYYPFTDTYSRHPELRIQTLKDGMWALRGDYIIWSEEEGEFCPCKPDTFAATYESNRRFMERGV
jgi:hypothetical protein